jgi:hypothetical protein
MAEDLCRAKCIEYFGNAELFNLPLLPSLLAARPMTKVVFIHRPMMESIKAAEANGYHIPTRIWQAMAANLFEYIEYVDWIVPFRLIDDEATMRMLWEKVLPGLGWNQRRWQAFVGKRIVCNRSKVPERSYEALEQFLRSEVEPINLPSLG